ncbi:1-deoxy-D-xylulose-5-phosphate synthase [Mesoterricola sediminis]|uniref:1-deoxy-D-xylulose-5-phosphate synthase n=1 Tax=Mesoterricola sediminis TaxID=2927980 RepID=A0AA48GT44_9BACT|nr:1-deoxy-D-xylulose-5-phosphate synthase [Mesoterricola sediminis]BDU75175.1 1-deoxy-D-xylulose-5-phosphate synthase [Mesoterricola sediminis]
MSRYPLLDSVAAPQQIHHFSLVQMEQLAQEVRDFIIASVSETGGHFSSNLGTVELTVGLMHHFDFLVDRIVWDVGHQAYPFKILTGRKDRFSTLRKHNGLSGFLKREESPYDHFGAGHASTSISAALGMAKARDLTGQDYACVAVIGDGSMTAGMAFEGLNQAGFLETRKFMVILNDNDMSINPNVGSLQGYLNQMISGQYYNRWRDRIEHAIKTIPVASVSRRLAKAAKWSEESFKRIAVPGLLFEDLGFRYIGPVNGHDVAAVLRALREAKERMAEGPVLLHVQTQKGHGYDPAVKDPLKWHGVTAFDRESGEIIKPAPDPAKPAPPSYTAVFGNTLTELARRDEKIVGITAAMLDGTGLNLFQKAHPARCFDVGIAEQHAVTFAAGLACQGLRPVAAIYSTFLQRGFDQVLHDVCLQNLPVTFAMDRGGIVGADGPTHHGLYDLAYLRCMPNLILMAPKDENELRRMLFTAIYSNRPAALRYPRGNALGVPLEDPVTALPIGKGELLREGRDLLLVAVGTLVASATALAERLAGEGLDCAVINARFIKPLDEQLIGQWARHTRAVVALEEGCAPGGFTGAIAEFLADQGIARPLLRCAVPDHIVHHGDHARLLDEEGLSPRALYDRVKAFAAELRP